MIGLPLRGFQKFSVCFAAFVKRRLLDDLAHHGTLTKFHHYERLHVDHQLAIFRGRVEVPAGLHLEAVSIGDVRNGLGSTR